MNIDRRFLNVQLLVDGVANTPASTSAQYIIGSEPSGEFQGAEPNSIAYYDSKNEKWIFIAPSANVLEVFNTSTKEFLRWDGSSWAVKVSLMTCDATKSRFITFYHTIIQEEIENKSFTMKLSNSPYYTYVYRYIALLLNGVHQRYDGDFKLSSKTGGIWTLGNYWAVNILFDSDIQDISIIWDDGFNNMDIRAGDIVALQLMAIDIKN